MPMKPANGGCSSGFIMKLRGLVLSFMPSGLPQSSRRARKPFRGKLEVLAGQAVAGTQHLVGDVGAGLAEQRGQQARALDRDEFVVVGRDQQHRDAAQIGQGARVERQHGAQQDRAGERARLLAAAATRRCWRRWNSRARPASAGDRRRARCAGSRQARGAALEIVDVPGAVGRAAEEARDAVLVDLAARRQRARGRARSARPAEAGRARRRRSRAAAGAACGRRSCPG